jgi:hypothetical protein
MGTALLSCALTTPRAGISSAASPTLGHTSDAEAGDVDTDFRET